MHINPDHFLETALGRVITPERNAAAWEQCFNTLDTALAAPMPDARLYLLIGAQGSGKSTWAKQLLKSEPSAIIFDAILVTKSERAPILAAAKKHDICAVAVWFRTPLLVCLSRNADRPADQVASEQGLRNVFAAIEEPSQFEGFSHVLEVTNSDACLRGQVSSNVRPT